MAYIRKARTGDENGIHESHMRSIREVCVHDHGEEEIGDECAHSGRLCEHAGAGAAEEVVAPI